MDDESHKTVRAYGPGWSSKFRRTYCNYTAKKSIATITPEVVRDALMACAVVNFAVCNFQVKLAPTQIMPGEANLPASHM